MIRRISSCLILGLFVAANAAAQLASQTALVVTVTDSGGLVIRGEQVVAVNVGTRDTYQATTNSEGYYHIQFVRPGRYEITVTTSGFGPFKATGVEVATNQVVRTNATLQVGAMADTVTVEAKAQVLDTYRATVSATIGERAIVELPLNARGYFDNPAIPKAPRNSKQFGAELDGPLVIPGLYNGRNQTFFMVAYEGVRGEAITQPIASVPTALMRQGNFSEISTPVRNPATKQPFPGNIIPPSMISPVSRELLQYFPEANRAGTANNYQGPSENSDNVDQVLIRLDQNIGNKARLSLRYNWHDSYSVNPLSALIPIVAVTQPRVNKNWLFGYTHTLRTNLHNDFRIGYHHIDFDTLNQFSVTGKADAGTSLGIPGFDGDTKFGNPGIPSVNVSNFTGIGAGGTNWFQLVPPAPIPVKLLTLTLGIPGLPNFVSPSNPGMPSDVPASALPVTENWFRVSKSMWW